MGWLGSLFRKSQGSSAGNDAQRLVPVSLEYYSDTTLPIPVWKKASAAAPRADDAAASSEYWWSAALAWLESLRTALGERYAVSTSDHFAILSTLDARRQHLTIEFCERARKRILRALDGIASSWGSGPHIVLIFDDADTYYRYIGHYYPERGTFAMSAGLFIKHGYGHFVFVGAEQFAMEPIIAHELTHCLVAPLPLPAWLNEGTAVNMEASLVPHARDPRRGIFEQREKAKKYKSFWNAQTIQEFWSGKSFLRPDEGCALSYDLGAELTRLVARDYGQYRSFMTQASIADAGEAAALSVFGFSLADLAGAVLGDGDWKPDPTKWRNGTERGQFSRVALFSSPEGDVIDLSQFATGTGSPERGQSALLIEKGTRSPFSMTPSRRWRIPCPDR